jgi:Ser/Thr protein kinase RdoA (MazF antagonist)
VSDGLDRFDAQAAPALPGLRRQVIHNDLNPHNIIVAEAPASHITGIIDFGDMVRAPLVNDVATAASYHVAQGEGPLGNALAAIRAYHAVRPLEAAEIGLLPLLIATRNILTLAITAWRASLYPDNRDYILRNVPAATAALRKLADLGQEPAADLIRQACRQEPAR